jgi:hypothetical protein
VAISADGSIAISGSADTTVKVWDLKDGRCLKTLSHDSPVQAVAITSDSKKAISGSQDGKLIIWDLQSGNSKEIESNSKCIWTVAATPDENKVVFGSENGTFGILNLKNGSLQKKVGQPSGVIAVAITSNGELALSGSEDGWLNIWNLKTQDVLCHKKAYNSGILAVAITSDGKKFLLSSNNSILKISTLNEPDQPIGSCDFLALDITSTCVEDSNLESYKYHLSRFYIWFNLDKHSSSEGVLTTKEQAANIIISGDGRWEIEECSDPKIGPYWVLYPKEQMILMPKESVTFTICNIKTEENPGMTWLNLRYHILGYKDETKRISINKIEPTEGNIDYNVKTCIDNVKSYVDIRLPKGIICMWSGDCNKIPKGWALCNGYNGTPNLQSRFIVGSGNDSGNDRVNASGDATAHNHNVSLSIAKYTESAGSHLHQASDQMNFKGDGNAHQYSRIYNNYAGDHSHVFSLNESKHTSDWTSEIRPKWYALCFIMKLELQ